MAVKGTVAGFDPATRDSEKGPKAKALDVEVDGRDVVVSVVKQHVALDRQTVPSLIQLLQAAFIEVA